MVKGQCGELFTPASEESIGADDKRVCSQFDQGYEDRIEIALRARVR